jgi:hypothetical protein
LTKLARLPSLELGLRQAFRLLGDDGIAAALHDHLGLDRSPSLLRKCADPDDDSHHIQHRYSVAIDAACKQAGHVPPLLAAHQQLLGQLAEARDGAEPPAADLTAAMLELQAAIGSMARRVSEATDPAGPGGADLTETERHQINNALARLEEDISAIRRLLATPAP